MIYIIIFILLILIIILHTNDKKDEIVPINNTPINNAQLIKESINEPFIDKNINFPHIEYVDWKIERRMSNTLIY